MKTFYAALYNTFRVAKYSHLISVQPPTQEYMILNRPTEEVLTISNAGAAPTPMPDCAPKELREINTIVGTLIGHDPETGVEKFVLNRNFSDTHMLRGRFFPAEGTAILQIRNGKPWLVANGRHSHARVFVNGQAELVYADGRAEDMSDVKNWQFDARPLIWSEEIYNGDFL